MKHFFPEPDDSLERLLFARVEKCDGPRGLDPLTPNLLRQLTVEEGCDFATALMHRRIVESEQNGGFLRTLIESSDRASGGCTVAIVPGAFYRDNPRTGADGRVVREVTAQLGLPVVVVPVSSTGSIAENARLLSAWLAQSTLDRLILVSVSKGGSDVKTALAQPDAGRSFGRVAGWLNLCGILDGTPMADWLLSPG